MYLYGLGKDGTFLLIKRRDVFGWKVCGWCFSLDVGVITASVQGLRENMFLKSETHNLFLQLPQYLSLRGREGGRERGIEGRGGGGQEGEAHYINRKLRHIPHWRPFKGERNHSGIWTAELQY